MKLILKFLWVKIQLFFTTYFDEKRWILFCNQKGMKLFAYLINWYCNSLGELINSIDKLIWKPIFKPIIKKVIYFFYWYINDNIWLLFLQKIKAYKTVLFINKWYINPLNQFFNKINMALSNFFTQLEQRRLTKLKNLEDLQIFKNKIKKQKEDKKFFLTRIKDIKIDSQFLKETQESYCSYLKEQLVLKQDFEEWTIKKLEFADAAADLDKKTIEIDRFIVDYNQRKSTFNIEYDTFLKTYKKCKEDKDKEILKMWETKKLQFVETQKGFDEKSDNLIKMIASQNSALSTFHFNYHNFVLQYKKRQLKEIECQNYLESLKKEELSLENGIKETCQLIKDYVKLDDVTHQQYLDKILNISPNYINEKYILFIKALKENTKK